MIRKGDEFRRFMSGKARRCINIEGYKPSEIITETNALHADAVTSTNTVVCTDIVPNDNLSVTHH